MNQQPKYRGRILLKGKIYYESLFQTPHELYYDGRILLENLLDPYGQYCWKLKIYKNQSFKAFSLISCIKVFASNTQLKKWIFCSQKLNKSYKFPLKKFFKFFFSKLCNGFSYHATHNPKWNPIQNSPYLLSFF